MLFFISKRGNPSAHYIKNVAKILFKKLPFVFHREEESNFGLKQHDSESIMTEFSSLVQTNSFKIIVRK